MTCTLWTSGNPDFRTRDEYNARHLVTAVHYDRFQWEAIDFRGMILGFFSPFYCFNFCSLKTELCSYSVVVFYDADGTAAANLYTILYRAFNKVKSMGVSSKLYANIFGYSNCFLVSA
jgi:hypothetical protein